MWALLPSEVWPVMLFCADWFLVLLPGFSICSYYRICRWSWTYGVALPYLIPTTVYIILPFTRRNCIVILLKVLNKTAQCYLHEWSTAFFTLTCLKSVSQQLWRDREGTEPFSVMHLNRKCIQGLAALKGLHSTAVTHCVWNAVTINQPMKWKKCSNYLQAKLA